MTMANNEKELVKEKYDSTPDTLVHIKNIQMVFNLIIIPELIKRAKGHDVSKLESPEKETYDKYIPLLRSAKYGTDEYNKIRESMAKEGLSHHYSVNRHHPEHFKDLVNGMNLVDFVEMICDWFAASLRSDTSFIEGLKPNQEKYDLPDMVMSIIKNTYEDYFEDFENLRKDKKTDQDYINELKLNVYETERNDYYSETKRNALIQQIDTIKEDR